MLLDMPQPVTGAGLLVLGVSAGLLAVVVTCISRRFLSPLAKYPGPFWGSLTDLWFARLQTYPDCHRRIVGLHERYGPVVRVKPNKLIIASPDAFKAIYGAGNNYVKSDQYIPFRGKRPFDLFAEQNERIHGTQRRLVSSAYTLDMMKSLEPFVNTTVQAFLDKLGESSAAGAAVDLSHLFQLFAFDVVGEITFARRFGYLDALSDFGTFETIGAALRSGAIMGEVPWLYKLHQTLSPVIGNWLAVAARSGKMHEFTVREIGARKDRGDDSHSDILGKLMASAHGDKSGQLSESDIGYMLTSNVVAGSDTTSISLTAIVNFLLRTPAALERLLRELRERVDAGEIERGTVVDHKVTERWPYLQAIIYEGMRLHAASGGVLSRIAPPRGLEFDGHFVPGGTELGASPWSIHLSKDFFGQDAKEYRPDRWLDQEGKFKMHRYFFGFGGGSRTCIGKNIALLEMTKVLPTLFLHFDLELANPSEPPKEIFIGLVSLKPFNVFARKSTV